MGEQLREWGVSMVTAAAASKGVEVEVTRWDQNCEGSFDAAF